MIRGLVVGTLKADPQQRTTKNGDPYAFGRMTVAMGDQGRISCSLIAFEAEAVKRLMQLREGAAVSAAGRLEVGAYAAKDGGHRPSMNLIADEIASTTPRPRRPRPAQQQRQSGDWPGNEQERGA